MLPVPTTFIVRFQFVCYLPFHLLCHDVDSRFYVLTFQFVVVTYHTLVIVHYRTRCYITVLWLHAVCFTLVPTAFTGLLTFGSFPTFLCSSPYPRFAFDVTGGSFVAYVCVLRTPPLPRSIPLVYWFAVLTFALLVGCVRCLYCLARLPFILPRSTCRWLLYAFTVVIAVFPVIAFAVRVTLPLYTFVLGYAVHLPRLMPSRAATFALQFAFNQRSVLLPVLRTFAVWRCYRLRLPLGRLRFGSLAALYTLRYLPVRHITYPPPFTFPRVLLPRLFITHLHTPYTPLRLIPSATVYFTTPPYPRSYYYGSRC